MTQDIIQTAKNIIQTEIDGAKQLLESINEDFVKACNLLLNLKGRIIITGMGKSGHIANKISATLASTGSPAFFVHPAESIHGDLGMITKEDAVIAISNSGNTLELSGILSYCQRFSIPIIAITSNKDSELGKASNYCLLLPKAKEACILGLAPTTSTTNSLIMGDAIAITLLELKGFKPEDFQIFHPGGSLGNALVKIKEVMHKEDSIPLILQNTKMDKALIKITSHKFGCAGVVVENNNLIGIITDGDIRRHMDSSFLAKSTDEVMTKSFITIAEDENTSKALYIMNKNKITSLFVIKNNKPIGIIHLHDLLNLGVV